MTSDADPPVRPDNVAVIFIAATPDRVWKALTDPADQATYFGGKTEMGQQGEGWVRHGTDKWPALTGVVQTERPAFRVLHVRQDHDLGEARLIEQVGDVDLQVAEAAAERGE